MKKGDALRSCIGCRTVRPKKELLRLVLSPGGTIVADSFSKLPGRGCYLCADKKCIRQAVKKNAFSRAFKTNAPAPLAEELVETFYGAACSQAVSLLSMALRAGMVLPGTTAVEDGLKRGSVMGGLLIASDMSETAKKEWRGKGDRSGLAVRELPATEKMLSVIGNKKVLGLKEAGMAERLNNQLDRIACLKPDA